METTDYHSLPRRRLQILCKQHGIPANTTNLAMATALDALLNGASTESNVSGVSEVVDCSSGDEIRTPVRKSAAGVKKQATTTRKSRVKKPEVIVVDDEKEENHEAEEKVSAAKSQAKRPVTRGLRKQVGSEEPTQPNFATNDLVNGETPAKEAKKGSTRSVAASAENHEAEEKVSAAKSQAKRPVTRGLRKQVGSEEPTQPDFATNDLVNGETPAKEAKKGFTRSVAARSTRKKKDKSIALEDNLGTEELVELQNQVSEETLSLDQCKTELKTPVDIPCVISAVVDGCIGLGESNQDASRGDSSIDISQASFQSTAKKVQAAGSSDDLPSLCEHKNLVIDDELEEQVSAKEVAIAPKKVTRAAARASTKGKNKDIPCVISAVVDGESNQDASRGDGFIDKSQASFESTAKMAQAAGSSDDLPSVCEHKNIVIEDEVKEVSAKEVAIAPKKVTRAAATASTKGKNKDIPCVISAVVDGCIGSAESNQDALRGDSSMDISQAPFESTAKKAQAAGSSDDLPSLCVQRAAARASTKGKNKDIPCVISTVADGCTGSAESNQDASRGDSSIDISQASFESTPKKAQAAGSSDDLPSVCVIEDEVKEEVSAKEVAIATRKVTRAAARSSTKGKNKEAPEQSLKTPTVKVQDTATKSRTTSKTKEANVKQTPLAVAPSASTMRSTRTQLKEKAAESILSLESEFTDAHSTVKKTTAARKPASHYTALSLDVQTAIAVNDCPMLPDKNAELQDEVPEEFLEVDQSRKAMEESVDIPVVISAGAERSFGGCAGLDVLEQEVPQNEVSSCIDMAPVTLEMCTPTAMCDPDAESSDDLPNICSTLTSPKSCGNSKMLFLKQTGTIIYGTELKEANGESHYVVNHVADHDEVSEEADFVELEMKGEEHATLKVEFLEENCSSEEGIEGCEEVKSIECQSVEQVDDFIETKEEHYSSNEKVGCMVNHEADHDEVVEEADFVELEMKGEERAPLKVEFPEENCSSEEGIEGCEEVKSTESVEQVDDFIETKEEHYSSNEKVGFDETGFMAVERSENEFTKADWEAYEEVTVMKCQSIEQADECEDMKAEKIPDAFVLSPEKHFPNKDVESGEFGTGTFGELNHIVTNCASEIHVEDNAPTSPLYTDLLPQNEMLQKKQIEVLTTETHIEGDALELLSHNETEGEQVSSKPALLATVDVDNASSIHEVCKTDGADMVDDGILNAAADLPNSIGDHSVNPEGFKRKENALESIEVTLTNSSAGSHVDCRIAIVQESFQQPDQILYEGCHGVHSMEQVDALIIEEEKTVCKVNLEGKSLRQIKKMAKELSKTCAERPESTCGEFSETPKQADLFADSQGTKDADSQCARLAEEMHHKCNLVDKENMLEDKSLKDLKKILKEKLALRRKDNEAPTTVVRGLSENKSRANIQAQH